MNKIPNKIGPFMLDDSDTTMEYGYYYKAEFNVPFSENIRTIRVWIPENYDFENKDITFPVMYFSDGQNLVNKYLTAFGDWGLDKVAHKLLIEDNISFIAVGIDSPKDDLKRSNELNPPFKVDYDKRMNPYGNKFINFIADELKLVIDKHFNTKCEKEYTAIAGSSMGGIMAFYAGVLRKDTFSFALDFSPAFLLYKIRNWKKLLDSFNMNPDDNVKHYLYVGGKKFERIFVRHTKYTYKYLKELGFSDDMVTLDIDKPMIHHESAWNKHLGQAIKFWLK